MSAEIGGLQNTFTNFGASLGTALVGAVLIGSLTSAFLTGAAQNQAIPASVTAEATVTLEAGIPFVSDAQLKEGLATTSLTPATQDAIVAENASARLVGLRTALSVVALIIVLALFLARMLPDTPIVADEPDPRRVGAGTRATDRGRLRTRNPRPGVDLDCDRQSLSRLTRDVGRRASAGIERGQGGRPRGRYPSCAI